MNRAWIACLAITIVPVAAKAEDADTILKYADQAYAAYKDLTIESTMTIYEPGASTGRTVAMTTLSKGTDKRRVIFTEPGDIKGMGFLVENSDTMYAYLPGFARIRRMGTHVKNQSFMGSDVSFEDMSVTQWVGTFKPTLVGEENGNWILDLTILPGKETEFPHKKIWVDQKIHQVTRLDDFTADGKLARTQVRAGFKPDENNPAHQTPATITVIDHRRNDHKTVITTTKAMSNTNVPDDAFSQRALLRGT